MKFLNLLLIKQGVFARAFLVISYEGEMPLVAKRDRDGITATGDWLSVAFKDWSIGCRRYCNPHLQVPLNGMSAYTVWTDSLPLHTVGPNIEALITTTSIPTGDLPSQPFLFNAPMPDDTLLFNAEPCFAKTGDLFFDLDESPGSFFLEDNSNVERNRNMDLNSGNIFHTRFSHHR